LEKVSDSVTSLTKGQNKHTQTLFFFERLVG